MKILNKIIGAFFAGNRIFYINGADKLPPPLSAVEEAAAISALPSDTSAKNLLIEHNLRLVVYIAKKFDNTGVGIEDLISIGTIGLIKAVSSFDAEKHIKLATYASRCIENEILMYIRKNCIGKSYGHGSDVSIDEPLNTDRDGNELLLSDILGGDGDGAFADIEAQEDNRILRAAVERLNEREQQIVALRFGIPRGDEHTQKEVADMLGISQSYISRLEKKIITQLKDEISAYI